jgi:superfamily II DNA or RNA helicase
MMPSFREYIKARKQGKVAGWNGILHLADRSGPNAIRFSTGLVPRVAAYLGAECHLFDERHFPDILPNKSSVDLRDYQTEAARDAVFSDLYGMWWPRGVIKVATGGGKTRLSCSLIESLPVPTVFLVHRIDLMRQSKGVIEEQLGVKVGIVGESEFDLGQRITVATIQSIAACCKSRPKEMKAWIPTINQVVMDEAHLIAKKTTGGNVFSKVLSLFRSAPFRWGLTATPFMRDEFSNMLLVGATGELLVDITNDDLIKRGYLARPKVVYYRMEHPNAGLPKKWPDVYNMGITLNMHRNAKIVDVFRNAEKPAMIMVKHISHAKILTDDLKAVGCNVEMVSSEVRTQDRAKIIEDLKHGKLDGCVSTPVFDEGIDIPELRTIILGGGGNSPIKLLQRSGRGLRIASEKTTMTIVDFDDVMSAKLRDHSLDRKKVFEGEGFEIVEVK